MENNKKVVPIVRATLAEQVEAGMKKKELALHYGISVNQMTKALQACGLQIKKNHYPTFQLIDEAPAESVATETAIEEVAPTPEQIEQVIQEGKAEEEASVEQVDNNVEEEQTKAQLEEGTLGVNEWK